ncbi:MAG: hypothetical protein M3Z27_07480 [Actinomycetota bacterium]|nr:hypothetical protein [Actinomycetota bacterium]
MRSLLHRRPSPAMAVSLVALFVSLGGVGYAAVSLPHNSVGNFQLRNNSVSYKKIVPGAVGIVRANTNQLQVRVSGQCGPSSGIGSVDSAGKVSCNPSLPPQAGIANTAGVTSKLTPVNTLALKPTGSYLAWANPTATVAGNGTNQRVTVSCTLTLGSNTQTRTVTINTGTALAASSESIPLQLAASAGSSGVSCTSSSSATPAATVNVTSSLNTIQTAS